MSSVHKEDKITKNGSKSGKTFLQKLYAKFKNPQVSEESKNNAGIIQTPPKLLMSELETNQQIETQEELQLEKLVKSIILEDMLREEEKKRKEEETKIEKKRLEDERKSIEKIRKKEGEKRKSIEEQRKHQFGSFQCSDCNKFFYSKNAIHECQCIFCREPFQSSILHEHHQECLQRPIPWHMTDSTSFSREREVFQPIGLTNSLIFHKPHGLTKQQIESFPIMNYKNKDKKANTQEKCAICMEMFLETRKLRVLPCFHNYHVECIDKWLILQNFCPICKQDMKF